MVAVSLRWMNRPSLALIGIFVLLTVSCVQAAQWVSPDGKIAIQQPPAPRFTQDQSLTPPAIARWTASDDMDIVAVVVLPNPSNAVPQENGLIEGTLKQLENGKLISTSRTTLSGIPAFTIIASGNVSGTSRYLAQTIVAFNGQAYKVMIGSPGNPTLDTDLNSILLSMRIVDPRRQPLPRTLELEVMN